MHSLTLLRLVWILLAGCLAAGCVGTRKSGISQYDPFNAIQVDQMVGNNVSGKMMERTVLCLNARRETRAVTAWTNEAVLLFTNPVVTAVTNMMVSLATNYSVTATTNLNPLTASAPAEAPELAVKDAGATAAPETAADSALAAGSTNMSFAAATNQTLMQGSGQTTRNIQVTRNISHQTTIALDQSSVTSATNCLLTAETNWAVHFSTNFVISAVTNVSITPTAAVAHAYYLYTELLAPPDFSLLGGESLVLLVDGQRHGFTASHARDPFIVRKGYASTLYPVTPDVLVAIANAQEVKIRVNGISSVIEKEMTARSRQNVRTFLLRFFQPGAGSGGGEARGVPGSIAVSQAQPGESR